MTCRRDRFPNDLDNKYLLSAREAVNKVNKVARFNNPIVAVKKVEANETEGHAAYERVHVSFQSTGSCNISTVNDFDSVHAYVKLKKRGRGMNKRRCGIEMN